MAQQNITIGTQDAGGGDTLFAAFTKVEANFTELYNDDAGDVGSITGGTGITASASTGDVTLSITNDGVDHDQLAGRYTEQASISTLTGTVSFNCSTASNFKLTGDLTGAYTIDLSNYKKGQVITIFPLKAQSVTLDAQGSSTNTFYKIGGIDYDNTTTNILQIECVDDSSSDPIFFYSVGTYASDNTI